MVKDVFWEVRNNIAKNPSTPEDLLTYLSMDRIMDVRVTAAQNPRTPAEALARNELLEGKILDELSGHWSWMVRVAVAENPNTTAETLKRLAEDLDQSVQKAAKNWRK